MAHSPLQAVSGLRQSLSSVARLRAGREKSSLGEILINRSIKLFETVWKTFVVAAGIAGERADTGREQRWIPDQQFVCFLSMPEPEIIRML
jgi:hypothetical protein